VFRKLRRINRTSGIRGSRKECEYSMSCLAVSIEGWQVLEWRWRWELLGSGDLGVYLSIEGRRSHDAETHAVARLDSSQNHHHYTTYSLRGPQ
jgi:hypothetical protein